MSAPTNTDAREISTAIRAQRRAMSQLGADARVLHATDQAGVPFELPVAVGDRVRLFDRATARFTGTGTHGNIGNNGSVLEVRGIDEAGLLLRNAAGREGLVCWGTLRDRESGRVRLTYGDVLSIDATQGVTSTEHINAMPGGSKAVNAHKGYVAESRHRRTTWLVTSDGAERQEVAWRRPLGDQRPLREKDVWDNVARNLAREPEKGSALAFLERARDLKRGGARALQEGLQPAEARQARGQGRSTLAGAFMRRREEAGIEGAAEQLAALARRQAEVMDRLTQLGPAIQKAVASGAERGRPLLRRVASWLGGGAKPALTPPGDRDVRQDRGPSRPRVDQERRATPEQQPRSASQTPRQPGQRPAAAQQPAEAPRTTQGQRDEGRQQRATRPMDDAQVHRQRAAARPPDAGTPPVAQWDRDAARQRRGAKQATEAQANRQRTASVREQAQQAQRRGPRMR